jgi:hypothetical protein
MSNKVTEGSPSEKKAGIEKLVNDYFQALTDGKTKAASQLFAILQRLGIDPKKIKK